MAISPRRLARPDRCAVRRTRWGSRRSPTRWRLSGRARGGSRARFRRHRGSPRAAAMTPPRPPQTTIAPRLASSRPTSCGVGEVPSVALLAPTTATYGVRERVAAVGPPTIRTLTDDYVDELVGHDHDLDDLVAIDVLLDAGGGERKLLQLFARGTGRRPKAIADLAVDLNTSSKVSACEHRRVRDRPRRLPDPLAGQLLEHLGAQMRCEREQQRGGGGGREAPRLAGRRRVADDLVESSITAAIAVWKPNLPPISVVTLSIAQCALRTIVSASRCGSSARRRCPSPASVCSEAVEPRQEPVDPPKRALAPGGVLVGRADEEDVAARRVGAEALDDRRRADHVAGRLRHLLAIGPRIIPE